jgi:hypothetical protein
MRVVDDLAVQKRLWGHDGHGLPGANPNYAGRIGMLAAAVVLLIAGGAFVLLTNGHTQNKTATQYMTDVATDESMQSQLNQSLLANPAKSATIVHDLVQTLLKEDQRLTTQHWPQRVEIDIKTLVASNRQQISVLNEYTSASSLERTVLLKQQNNDAYSASFDNFEIRGALDANS